MLQHFRGNLDNWYPALIDALAPGRRVITFDSTGVGGSAGTTPDTIEQMARDALAFLTALDISQADLLGFSIGEAQYDAVCAWGIPNHALLERVTAIRQPVFVANGDGDPMILPRYSHLLAGLLPDARIEIYPDSAHGFLFQHHARFAADVHASLDEAG